MTDNLSYSKGICWIDDCRIPFVDENTSRKQTPVKVEVYGWANHKGQIGSFDDTWKQGRFPANILVSDDVLNDGVISKSSSGGISSGINNSKNVLDLKTYHRESAYEDKGTNSRYYDIDKWFDKLLDE